MHTKSLHQIHTLHIQKDLPPSTPTYVELKACCPIVCLKTCNATAG